MSHTPHGCDLCGLPVRQTGITLDRNDRTYGFCCNGCRQVFILLSEAPHGNGDYRNFGDNPLVDRCRSLGLIPPAPDGGNPPSPLETNPMEDEPSTSNLLTLTLNVQGMWCPACAWLIEETLNRTPGVSQSACHFDLDRVRCHYDPVKSSPQQISDVIAQLGYQPAPLSAPTGSGLQRRAWIRLAICGFLTMNVMMLSFALYSGFFSTLDTSSIGYLSWPIFIMGSLVVAYGGYPIFRRAWSGLSSAAYGMETLITVGVAGAYGLSLHHFFQGGLHLFFDTAAMLITLVLLGKHLEQNAKTRIRSGLDDFRNLRPTKAKIIMPGATQGRYTSVDQLGPGDLFEISQGEVVPTDGIITRGRGRVDMSAITGEARPVGKRPGEPLISGSRILSGTFKVRARRPAGESVLGQMLEIMDRTLEKKTHLEGRTDKILRGFVPTVLCLALGTVGVLYFRGHTPSEAWLRGVTVLVISCPCALGIAIPLARVAALSVALRQGFLVRDFACFEQVEGIDTVLFDKTGTLTRGEWALSEIEVMEPFERRRILQWAAALESEARHPAARQILLAVEKEGITLENHPMVQGMKLFENGVCGEFGDHYIRLGSWNFIQSHAVSVSSPSPWPLARDRSDRDAALHSRIYMTVDGAPAATFIFDDELRPSAAATIKHFLHRGYHVALVSGDESRVTRRVASWLGIRDVQGGMSPREKAEKVAALQTQGRTVAMVGDGVNDAPAMAMARVGFALGTSYDLGREAAGVTLMAAVPEQLPAFWNLARKVNGKIYQNLAFTFVYNLLSIPIAMSGWLSPPLAVGAMLLSSLSVIGNTMGLLRKEGGSNRLPEGNQLK